MLDTNFIIECIKRKVDMFEIDGSLVIPQQVIIELEDIRAEGSLKDRTYAETALKIFGVNKEKISIVKLETKYVDMGITRYAEKNKIVVATLDNELKEHLRGKARILTLAAGKKLVFL